LPRADNATALLRALPGVDALVTRVEGHAALAGVTRRRVTDAARDVLAAERRRVLEGEPAGAAPAAAPVDALAERVVARLSQGGAFSLARVVNATGVVLHTNLGRALLSPLARERLQAVAGAYSNLEMDVNRKERGSRYVHVDALLQRLTGAQSSLVVNNCASAVLLALESLARGKEVIVSRGELIEIGGEFRIPDIMRRSGRRSGGRNDQPHAPQGLCAGDRARDRAPVRSTHPTIASSASPPPCPRASLPTSDASGACLSWRTWAPAAS
jgi:L-seryl-tRNA(Ser) seleniumtransferase